MKGYAKKPLFVWLLAFIVQLPLQVFPEVGYAQIRKRIDEAMAAGLGGSAFA